MSYSPTRTPTKPRGSPGFTFPPTAQDAPAATTTAAPAAVPPKQSPSPISSHRLSFSESLRNVPPSPHARRHLSINSQAFQELLNNPPLPHTKDENRQFEGRDWKTIKVGEVVDPQKVRFATLDTTVEDATETLINGGSPNVVLIRHTAPSRVALSTFDYSDLNAFLLIAVGRAHPAEGNAASFHEIVRKGREGKPIYLRDIKDLGRRDPFVTLPESASLRHAVEIFGSGIHRIIITETGSQDTVGVLTQLRLVEFFWENGRSFRDLEMWFPVALKDLNMGSKNVKAINGDRPLTDALELMNNESITSLPVLDNQRNVVGNISHVDVRLLTKSTSLPLLRSSCIHFISVILSERGVVDGKDSFPVFYVTPFSTLAHTAAKLVATRSHRMWLVDAPSPASSGPPTPSVATAAAAAPQHPALNSLAAPPTNGPPYAPGAGSSVSAGSLPGQHMSGRLSGVVSLTDVLNLFARVGGLDVQDPDDARRQRRRRSSSSSSGVSGSWGGGAQAQQQAQQQGAAPAPGRVSVDSARSSSASLNRSGSVGSARR